MSAVRQILFTAGMGGYRVHHVPGIVRTSRGVVVVSTEARYSRRAGKDEPNPDYRDHDILIRRSADGGATWLPQQVVLSHRDFGAGPLHNFQMIADRSGRIHALVLHDYTRLFYLSSDDDGATWSAPFKKQDVLERFRERYPWKAFATGCGHGIQLRSGRLLVPVWMSDNSLAPHRPSDAATVFSDDGGANWQAGDFVCRSNDVYRWPSESMAAELPDGHVMINLRNESDARRRLVSVSPDGISRWSLPQFAKELLEPVCEGAMLAFPDPRNPAKTLLAFSNPHSQERKHVDPAGNKSDRVNLQLKISTDLGQTWPISHAIEPGPANYSDMCAMPDGSLLVVFSCGMQGSDIHDSAFTVVERIDIEKILTGGEH
ncbi:hypothetical protein BH10PLA1_BH10PLA1_02720 [soil metagenome]